MNTMVAIATTKALTKQCPLLEKHHLELGNSWAQSRFRHLGFVRHMKTTGKVKVIPVGAKKEAELKFLHQIVNNVEKPQISPSLTINFDQVPSKYVQVSSTTMDEKEEINVPITGITDKKSITATFSITLGNKFLPVLLIYQGKTGQSLPKVKFPDGFNLRLYLPVMPYGNINFDLVFKAFSAVFDLFCLYFIIYWITETTCDYFKVL